MLTGLEWLALEVKYLDRAREFYVDHLDMAAREPDAGDGEAVALAAGDTDLILRRPTGVPRGGLHTHYAFSIPHEEYDDWWDRLSTAFDLVEHRFGDARSLYLYDHDDNCVELGQSDAEGTGIVGIFEVVLEVTDIQRAEEFYVDLGFRTVDRGEKRRRVRMAGPMDLELWEPHLGLADARGGVHVDLGFATDDPAAAAETVADRACGAVDVDDGVRVRDPDGHHLTFRRP